jgi:hypothetical protein
MQCRCVLVHYCCRLSAVAIRAVEIHCVDAMLAETAFKCGAASHGFSCVVPHCFILFPLVATSRTKRHRTLARVTTCCRAVNTDKSLNRVRSSLMTLLPKLGEPETPPSLKAGTFNCQVLVIVFSATTNMTIRARGPRRHIVAKRNGTRGWRLDWVQRPSC